MMPPMALATGNGHDFLGSRCLGTELITDDGDGGTRPNAAPGSAVCAQPGTRPAARDLRDRPRFVIGRMNAIGVVRDGDRDQRASQPLHNRRSRTESTGRGLAETGRSAASIAALLLPEST
jgi:hypothetical protein